MVDAVQSFCLEPLFARVEYHLILYVLAPRLAERLWPVRFLLLLLVHPWSWDFSLVIVLIEDLVVVEPGRSCVEANLAAENLLAVSCTGLVGGPEAVVVQVSDVVFRPKNGLLVVNMFACRALGNDLLLRTAARLQQSDVGVLSREARIEAVGGRHEDAVGLLVLVCQRRLQLCA